MTQNSCAETPMRFSLDELKTAVVFKFMAAKCYVSMRTFFSEVEMRWGDCKTARAYRRHNRPIIELGRKFYSEQIQTASEGAQVVMHELKHHMFGHLRAVMDIRTAGYSHSIVNIAEDAIINAFLHSIGCATFMERFYKDVGVTAFLRPNSRAIFSNCQDLATRCAMEEFYSRLYQLKVTLEESLKFFQTYFSDADDCPLLGSHGEVGQSEENQASSAEDRIGSKTDGVAEQNVPGKENVFTQDEALSMMRQLGILDPSASAKNNFLQVISKVTSSSKREGDVRQGNTISRRVPSFFRDSDMMNIESGRYIYKRPLRRKRDFVVFIDVSGSVTEYLPFALGLIQTLKRQDRPSRCFIWADTVEEIDSNSLGDITTRVGSGTNGEAVALEIEKLKLSEVLIITDNQLSPTPVTKIKARVHLCLIDGGTAINGFADKKVAADQRVYQLSLGDRAVARTARPTP